MRDYPIYKNLIQFSNLVDPEGNFLDESSKTKEEVKKPEEL